MIGVTLTVGSIKKVEINVSTVGFRNALLWGCLTMVSEHSTHTLLFSLWLPGQEPLGPLLKMRTVSHKMADFRIVYADKVFLILVRV